jgi:hypothetical protein
MKKNQFSFSFKVVLAFNCTLCRNVRRRSGSAEKHNRLERPLFVAGAPNPKTLARSLARSLSLSLFRLHVRAEKRICESLDPKRNKSEDENPGFDLRRSAKVRWRRVRFGECSQREPIKAIKTMEDRRHQLELQRGDQDIRDQQVYYHWHHPMHQTCGAATAGVLSCSDSLRRFGCSK